MERRKWLLIFYGSIALVGLLFFMDPIKENHLVTVIIVGVLRFLGSIKFIMFSICVYFTYILFDIGISFECSSLLRGISLSFFSIWYVLSTDYYQCMHIIAGLSDHSYIILSHDSYVFTSFDHQNASETNPNPNKIITTVNRIIKIYRLIMNDRSVLLVLIIS